MSKARDTALRIALKYMPRDIKDYRLWFSDFVMRADYAILYDYVTTQCSKMMVRYGRNELFLAKLGAWLDDSYPDNVFEDLPQCIYIVSLIAGTDLLTPTIWNGGHGGDSPARIKKVVLRRIDMIYRYR